MKRKPRVTVIDDDLIFGAMLARVAASEGIVVRHGASIDEIDPATLASTDVLVIDYHLEQGTGVELGQALHERHIRKPILLISASQDATRASDWPDSIRSFASKSVGVFGVLKSIHRILAAA